MKDNSNNLDINKIIKNNSSINIDKELKMDKEKEEKNKKLKYISNKNYINNILVSKRSIMNMTHLKQKTSEIYKRNTRPRKKYSFLDFIKSLFFKKEKGSHNFLTSFRKHLLSEEHLLKSHINVVLLEKKHYISNDESTNIFECYNRL